MMLCVVGMYNALKKCNVLANESRLVRRILYLYWVTCSLQVLTVVVHILWQRPDMMALADVIDGELLLCSRLVNSAWPRRLRKRVVSVRGQDCVDGTFAKSCRHGERAGAGVRSVWFSHWTNQSTGNAQRWFLLRERVQGGTSPVEGSRGNIVLYVRCVIHSQLYRSARANTVNPSREDQLKGHLWNALGDVRDVKFHGGK